MATIIVRDERPEINPKHVATFSNVPDNLNNQEILTQYGIASHLRVIRVTGDGERHIVQEGRR